MCRSQTQIYENIAPGNQGCGVLAFAGLQLRLRKFRTPTLTPELIVWHNDCVLKDDQKETLNSSNKRCTIVYSVSVVKWIAQKSNRLQQNYTQVKMKQIGPGVGVSFKWETPTPSHNCTLGDSVTPQLLRGLCHSEPQLHSEGLCHSTATPGTLSLRATTALRGTPCWKLKSPTSCKTQKHQPV